MKKLFILLATAVMVLPFAISCEKKSQPVEDVVMSPAATADQAALVSFENIALPEKPQYAQGGTDYEIVSIEFTEDSRYILRRKPLLEPSVVSTKAVPTIEVTIGTFSFANGAYRCSGSFSGTLTLGTASVTIELPGVPAETFQANITTTTSSTAGQVNANRTWKVDNCIVNISGDGVKIQNSFNGCDLKEIAQFASDNGVKNIDPSKLSGYKIQEMCFTGTPTMTITFAGADPFYGKYTLNGNNFSYTFENGNDLMGATATGTLYFPADKKADLTVSMGLSGYSGTIEFFLSAVN